MSRIEGLSVQGIRSFSPMHSETITLNTPLTLIVGYNGSGKTTLIECLKYATTGELPPNSKGGAFVYDPKLCSEKEVLASVRLKFRSLGGEEYTVARRLALKVTKSGRSQRTVDVSLKWSHHGERGVKSTKVSQVDELMAEYLGVSPAILDAVIFCHQDDSLWPMSEPSALKKRFDEIFEAHKYTKAIDNLKSLRKKKGEDLRMLKASETTDRENMEKGRKNQKLCEQLQREITELGEKHGIIEEQMRETQQMAKEKHEQANSFLSIMNELDHNKAQYDFRQNAVIEIRDSIEEMSDSDEALKKALVQHEAKFQRLAEEMSQNLTQYHDLQNEISESRKNINIKLAEKGKLESDKEKHERQLQTRVEMIQEAARRHEIRGYDDDLDDSQIRKFNDRMQSILAAKKKEVERFQDSINSETDKANAEISGLESRKNSLTQNKANSRQRIVENDRKIKRLHAEMNALNCDEGQLAVLQSDQQSLNQRYQDAHNTLRQSNWDIDIRRTQDELKNLESQSETLNAELLDCTRLVSERAQLKLRKDELAERQRRLTTLTNLWTDKLSACIGPEWQPRTAESSFQVVLKQQNKVVADAGKLKEDGQQRLKQVEYRLSAARERRAKMSAEMTRNRQSVLELLQNVSENPQDVTVDDYEEELDRLEDAKLVFEKDLSLFDKLKEYWAQAKSGLDRYNRCHMCERAFDDGSDPKYKSKLLKKISRHLSEDAKEAIEKDLSDAVRKLDNLRSKRPQYESYCRVTRELPGVDREIEAAEAEKEKIVSQLEGYDSAYRDADDKRQDMESLSKRAVEITQLFGDIEESSDQIKKLESQQQAAGPVRSAEEVSEDQRTCAEKIRVEKHKLDRLTNDRQRLRDNISSLELQRSELNNKITQTQQQMQRKESLTADVNSLRQENQDHASSISEADEQLVALQPQITTSRAKRDETLGRIREKQKKAEEDRANVARTISELKMIDDDVQDYLDHGGPAHLTSIQRTIQTLDQTIANLETETKDLTVRINKQREEQANGDRTKKNIHDNLNYRKNCRLLDELSAKIEELQSRNAHEDYDRLIREAEKLETQYTRLLAEKSSILGTSNSKDSELARLIDEYNLDYQDAEEKYRTVHLKVASTKAAIEDLGVYGSALDKAIMQYHSLKMEEVNRIAGELWRETYRGTDIDTIAIRSENESSNARRSYNYRVIMEKQDTEMDMRGRCSAGQKVLASIIIRLALAESFGVNCGLIALDEPTTNLDSDNIHALADSLHHLIKTRMAQSNFQLIVITHDEEFLRHMQCSDFCDTFYRVKRDENQCSVLSRESITMVSER